VSECGGGKKEEALAGAATHALAYVACHAERFLAARAPRCTCACAASTPAVRPRLRPCEAPGYHVPRRHEQHRAERCAAARLRTCFLQGLETREMVNG
jgi:hypothetical protein